MSPFAPRRLALVAGAQPKAGEAGNKAGSFSVESLIQAVPGMEKLATVKGEQIASIGFTSLDFWKPN